MRKGKKGLAGIVVVSHSNKLAEEVINFSKVLQQAELKMAETPIRKFTEQMQKM